MRRPQRSRDDSSIIALDRFIQATRDSGYKGTSSAVSELVDNAIQAHATSIAVTIAIASPSDEDSRPIEMSVLDDGCGMDLFTLRQALRFGGTTRFGDRSGLGRYGMGLPNASLSQARRVTVFTWQSPGQSAIRADSKRRKRQATAERVYTSYLDVDEIAGGEVREIPRPKVAKSPPIQCRGPSGTLVQWTRCDRLDNRRVSTISRKLSIELGRRFRHFLWDGLEITINGKAVEPFDPLYLHRKSQTIGATQFGDKLRYEIRTDGSDACETSWVEVQFSELPVHEWHNLSNQEKRRIGISSGAGVSIVRGGREVDSGWFFMGSKRRENYDDWWRCEVRFDPLLDEAFGITHTKQQVRPQPFLLEALTPDVEATARALNSRARKAHTAAKDQRFFEAEQLASVTDSVLRPLPKKATARGRALMKVLERTTPALRKKQDGDPRYRIVERPLKDTNFFSYAYDGRRLVLVINPDHPFSREIYRPLAEADSPREQQLRVKIELLLLAAARAEAAREGTAGNSRGRGFRSEWSDVLAVFLNG